MASTYVTTSVPSSDQSEPTLLDIKLSKLEFVKSNKPPCRSVFDALMRPDDCYPSGDTHMTSFLRGRGMAKMRCYWT